MLSLYYHLCLSILFFRYGIQSVKQIAAFVGTRSLKEVVGYAQRFLNSVCNLQTSRIVLRIVSRAELMK